MRAPTKRSWTARIKDFGLSESADPRISNEILKPNTIRRVVINDGQGSPIGPVRDQIAQTAEAIKIPNILYTRKLTSIPVIMTKTEVKSLSPNNDFPNINNPMPCKTEARGPYWAKNSRLGRYPPINAIAPVSIIPSW
jgi:hypothetical protein